MICSRLGFFKANSLLRRYRGLIFAAALAPRLTFCIARRTESGRTSAAISDISRKTIPGAEGVAFWGLLIGLNFLWYFGISLVAIKAHRLAYM